MEGKEIKRRININNSEIELLLSPNRYTLNNAIAQLMQENLALQAECPHAFDHGYCIYCDMEELKKED